MGSRRAISREAILEVAYDHAQREGMASLGIRTIANECGVAIGTIYNYFPDKAALVTEVVARFWRSAIEEAGVLARAEESSEGRAGCLLVYCRCLAKGLGESLSRFQESWLREISSLDSRSLERSRKAEMECFRGIAAGIARQIELDEGITPAARARFETQALADFIWKAMFGSIKADEPDCATLFSLLELALYR
ncbi:MAG: TetR/AcrR family transcriptional regulator [Coriobacteriaceae bacterium]|nr:TetR/AcrR family transcriptional regulator [Coriobacteriaceae bacterium]